MKKIIKQVKRYSELLDLSHNKHSYKCVILREGSKQHVLAKQLHTSVYKHLGFIDETDINEQGIISLRADPHQVHSIYFAVSDSISYGKPLAVARQINYKEELGYQSFPLMSRASIAHNHMSKIISYDPNEIVEISALVKAPEASPLSPLVLYKFMLDYSLKDRKHKVWLMALDTKVYKGMKYNFGGVLTEIGPEISLTGGGAIPLMMHTDGVFNVMEQEIKKSRLIQKQVRQMILSFYKSDLSFEFEQ